MIETVRQGLKEEGVVVSISQLCRWFEVPRCTFCHQSLKTPPKVRWSKLESGGKDGE